LDKAISELEMRIQVFTFFMLLSSFCFGQSKLKGFVREQNTGVMIEKAIVRSSAASNAIESNSAGQFILTFQDLADGANIIVRAEKDGWELVNEKEMSTRIPKNPEEKLFKIILCKAGTLSKARSEYYETFDLNLRTELAKQKALNKGNAKKLASLEEDFARVQKQLNDLADEYSRIDLTDASEKELKAIELFKAGRYDDFIALKKSMVTEAQVDKAIKNKQEAVKIIANTDSTVALYFKSQRDIANTLLLQFKFNEAEKVYENIVAKDTTDFLNTFDFAAFLSQQKQYDKAIQIYQKALKLTKEDPETARTENNLGKLYQEKDDYEAALNAYNKAVGIFEHLAKTNPTIYESELATVLTNLGVLFKDKNDYPAALNSYSKALEIRERLAKIDSSTYEPGLALTLNNLGILFLDKKNYPAALSSYNKALEIRERLAKTNPAIYESDLATTYHNLGALFEQKEDYPAALNSYSKALEITERLAKTNPAIYESDLAQTHNNLGTIYQLKNDYQAALNSFNKALEIFERLAKINPATYEPYVAYIQNNLGLLYQGKKDYVAAANSHSKAVQIFERLAKTNPDKYEIELCRSIVFLGLLQKADYQENRQMMIQEYLSKANQMLLKYTEIPIAKTILGYVNNLTIYFNDKKPLLQIKALQNEKEKSETYREKIKIQNKIIEQYRTLVSTTHKNLAYDLGASLSSLAWYYLLDKQFAAAENAAREALYPAKFNKTEGYDQKIEWANTNLALALLFQGQYMEAEKIYTNLKDKPYDKATYKEAFLKDLDELEKAGITHPDVSKIRTLLKN
jgi:tetratricopeptide (TPR) repeat protein